MPVMRILRRRLPFLIAFVIVLLLLAFAIFGLYQAWAYQTIYGAPYETRPFRFMQGVVTCALGVILLGPLLIVAALFWRIETRNLQKRELRPPIDDAIREPFEK
jgi:hypothetical protein